MWTPEAGVYWRKRELQETEWEGFWRKGSGSGNEKYETEISKGKGMEGGARGMGL